MSRETISNASLSRVGIRGIKVSDLTNPTTIEEIECAKLFDITRDAVLRAHRWGFAEKHAALSLLATVDPSDYGYTYAYQYPVDCLVAHEIFNAIPANEPIDFKKHSGTNLDTNQIWTSEASAVLVYTARVEATEAWDPSFTHAFTYAFGAAAGEALNVSEAKIKSALSQYAILFPNAEKNDAKEEKDSNRVTKRYKGGRKG